MASCASPDKAARHYILISDPGILQALAQLKASDISGVYDPNGMQDAMRGTHKDPALFCFTEDNRFVAALSHAFNPDKEQDFMHNKVMILDDRYVITGSYNFSENAELNDENILIEAHLTQAHQQGPSRTRAHAKQQSHRGGLLLPRSPIRRNRHTSAAPGQSRLSLEQCDTLPPQ
jgi:phosphatidylserine/phosphatidylglycerophosphate/cardiolipin synthase-like enzyme